MTYAVAGLPPEPFAFEQDGAIRRLLDNPAIDHIDAHNATRGCFSARIERYRSEA